MPDKAVAHSAPTRPRSSSPSSRSTSPRHVTCLPAPTRSTRSSSEDRSPPSWPHQQEARPMGRRSGGRRRPGIRQGPALTREMPSSRQLDQFTMALERTIKDTGGRLALRSEVGDHAVLRAVHRQKVIPPLSCFPVSRSVLGADADPRLGRRQACDPRTTETDPSPHFDVPAGFRHLFCRRHHRRSLRARASDSARSCAALGTTGTVLHIAAHPDDENTQLITAFARGRGFRAAYLSITRGDGGQNESGPEFGEKLGVARTQELLAARRLDRGRQFFTRAIDFGFSKIAGGRRSASGTATPMLGDVVRIIRTVPARCHRHAFSHPARQRRPWPSHGIGHPRCRGLQARGRSNRLSRAARRRA